MLLKTAGRRALLGGVAVLALAVPLDKCDDDGCASVCIVDPDTVEAAAANALVPAPRAR